jgi:hypothetical protein
VCIKILTIVRLNARQMELPSHVLAVYMAQIGHEESIFFACLASLGVDRVNALLERLANQTLRVSGAIIGFYYRMSVFQRLDCIVKRQSRVWVKLEDRRCHYQAQGSWCVVFKGILGVADWR